MRRLTALGATLLVFVAFGSAALAQGLADVRLGNEAFRQGDFAAAVGHYTDAIRSGELDGEALAITYNNRGVAYGEAGDFDPAIADYSQAMALRPGDATTIRNLRVAHERRGELRFASGVYDEAVADFTQAIELEPDHPLAYQRRGALYTELGLVDLAIDDLERALLLSPGDAEITSALQRVTAQQQRLAGGPTTAKETPREVAAADPSASAAPEPELPTLAETPAAALSREPAAVAETKPAETPPAEVPGADEAAPEVAAMPAPAPRATPSGSTTAPDPAAAPEPAAPEPAAAPSATAEERVIDTAPVAPRPPAAASTAEAEQPSSPAPAPAPAETTTAAVEGEPFRVKTAVNYRAGPDNDAQRLGTVDAGRIVHVTGDTLGWKHVILPNGDRGFIYGSWLEPAGS